MLLHADVGRLEPDGAVHAAQTGEVPLGFGTGGTNQHFRRDTSQRHLPRGLFAVATVGDQRQLVGAEHHPTVRAREAGEPANVGEVADEQCLGACVRQPGPHALGTLRDGHAAANLRTTACTASS